MDRSSGIAVNFYYLCAPGSVHIQVRLDDPNLHWTIETGGNDALATYIVRRRAERDGHA